MARDVPQKNPQLQRTLGYADADGRVDAPAACRIDDEEHRGDGEHGVGKAREAGCEEQRPQIGPRQKNGGPHNKRGDETKQHIEAEVGGEEHEAYHEHDTASRADERRKVESEEDERGVGAGLQRAAAAHDEVREKDERRDAQDGGERRERDLLRARGRGRLLEGLRNFDIAAGKPKTCPREQGQGRGGRKSDGARQVGKYERAGEHNERRGGNGGLRAFRIEARKGTSPEHIERPCAEAGEHPAGGENDGTVHFEGDSREHRA